MRVASLVLFLGVSAAGTASAQLLNLPLVNNGVPMGVGLAADVGFANADAGKSTTIGASGALGVGLVGLTVGIAQTSPETGDAIWSQAASATMNILGGPLVPIRLTLMGGMGRWEVGSETIKRYPISVGLGATIPFPALAIKPWLAPRYERLTSSSGESDDGFGISGGIDFAMINGLSLRTAYDRRFVDGLTPGIFSVGIGFAP